MKQPHESQAAAMARVGELSDDERCGQVSAAQVFDAYLCRAWGETDLTSAELVRDWEGVRRFMIREWLGEEDATDYDGTVTLDRFKADFDEHEEDLRGGAFVNKFEIGGVSVERVCGFAAKQPPSTQQVEVPAVEPGEKK